jgi:hypothetical protein
MNLDENNKLVEDEFSFSELLVPDTPEIKEIKSIYENEYEYSEYLSEIEFSIAEYYYNESRKVTDKDVIKALKNIKQNRDKPISFFEKALEKEIVNSLVEPLEESTLTDHEFTLVLDYILWVIDNRSWLEGKQAYVKWITYVLGFFSEEEEKKYERQFKKFASKMGVSGAQVDMLLMKKDAEDFFDEEELFEEGDLLEVLGPDEIFGVDSTADNLETGFFLMDNNEKFDYLLENGPNYVELVQSYVLDLMEMEDFEKIQDFYKKFNQKYKNFYPLHFVMGIVYIERDPALAKSYFEETLKAVEKQEEIPKSSKYEIKQNLDSLIKYLIEEPAENPEEKIRSSKKGKLKGVSAKKASNKDDEIEWI